MLRLSGLDLERQRDCLRSDLALDRVKDVDFERPADAVAREVFEVRIDDDLVLSGVPCSIGRETPLRLLGLDSDFARHQLAGRLGHDQDTLEQGAIKWLREGYDQRRRCAGWRRIDLP